MQKAEPALQLSLSLQHEISQVIPDPAPPLQMGFSALSQASLEEQLFKYNPCSPAFIWSLRHWSSVGGHSIFVALQSSHDAVL